MSANGSNARLDRIERLIEESERANKEAHARSERAHARSEQAHARSEQAHARSEQAHARHVREMAEIRAIGRKTRDDLRRTDDHLRRWAALGVREARAQRKRQREIDLNITRLSAAQLVTEEKLANFLSSLASGRNGGGRKAL